MRLKIDPRRLATAGPLARLSPRQVRKVILMGVLRHYPAGAQVVGPGDPVDGMFVVVTGELVAPDGREGSAPERYGPGSMLGRADANGGPWPSAIVASVASELLASMPPRSTGCGGGFPSSRKMTG